MRIRKKIIHVAGRAFVQGASTPFVSLETLASVLFVMRTEVAKQMKKLLRDEEIVEEVMKRVEANDANSICVLANSYHHGVNGLQRDEERAIELYARAADLGHSGSHYQLGVIYHEGGEKAKFHYEAAAMAGHEVARNTLGYIEFHSGNMERALKHTMIAASRGNYFAMHSEIISFEEGGVSRESIDSTLTAYNNSCAEMRSEERDNYILTRVRTRPM